MCCASLLSWSRYFEDRQVYAHSTSRREVARSKDEVGKPPEVHEANNRVVRVEQFTEAEIL